MDSTNKNRRSALKSLRVEEEFTNRQLLRVLGAASIYIFFATFLFCVFYVYVLNPAQIGKPSLLSFTEDLRTQWVASAELRGALQIWIATMVGMTACFAVGTGLVLSKKLAGPIHRLKTDLSRMRDGADIFPITLRDGDELQDLTDILNETLCAVDNRSGGRGSAAREQLVDEGRLAAIASLQAHLEVLPGTEDHGSALHDWSLRMQDLISKIEASKSDNKPLA